MTASVQAAERGANVAGRLTEWGARQPDRTAIVEYAGGHARRISYGEMAVRVERLAGALRLKGVAPGDRVLIFIPMGIDLYVTLIACMRVGAPAVFVDAWADRRRLDAAVEAARPRAFIGTPRAHWLRALSGPIRRIPVQVRVGGRWPGGDRPSGTAGSPTLEPVEPDHPALITFTTGSTGRPKAAARSHAFLWAQHEALSAHLQLAPTDVDMPTLPIFVLNNLALGLTSVLPGLDPRRPAEFDPAVIYRRMQAEGVTTSSGSPAFYERLEGWCTDQRLRLPLRALFTGGAPVLPPLARRLVETVTGEVHIVYGSTEAEPIAGIGGPALLAAMANPGTGAQRRQRAERRQGGMQGVCVGRPVPAIHVRLIRPDQRLSASPGTQPDAIDWEAWQVPEGEVGEVVVSGRHVLRRYLDDPAADRENKLPDGDRVWHRTGDAARWDDEGQLWLMGRVSQRVERAGQTWWTLPAELRALEAELEAAATRRTPGGCQAASRPAGGLTHAAYFGQPDSSLGQRAVLCIEVPGGRLSPAADAQLRAAMAPIPVDDLHAFHRLPRDPRHASGIDIEALRRSPVVRRGSNRGQP
jgi:acyl-CoA synthetase (AMP-forming)/AMP-acid ligase II